MGTARRKEQLRRLKDTNIWGPSAEGGDVKRQHMRGFQEITLRVNSFVSIIRMGREITERGSLATSILRQDAGIYAELLVV